MFRTILVPTDLSANADAAVRYAVRFGDAVGAAKILFFYANGRYLPTSTPQRLLHELEAGMVQEDTQKLHAHIQQVLVADGLEYNPHRISLLVRNGSYFEAIEEVLSEQKPDLVVMGTKGASGLRKYVLGSNTVKTLNLTTGHVLAVPGGYQYPSGQRILYATDLQHLEPEARQVAALARALHAALSVFHFYRPEQPEKRADERQLTQTLGEIIPDQPFSLLLKSLTNGEDIGTIMQATAEEQQTSLLVMFARGRGWLERLITTNHTAEVFYGSQVPVLAFRSA